MPETKPLYPLAGKRVWVAGHRGLVGSAVVRRLQYEDCEILTAPRQQVDLRHPEQVNQWMRDARPPIMKTVSRRTFPRCWAAIALKRTGPMLPCAWMP